jgi:[ribosomal protein S5]-alanine N-acetyltransferase
MRDHPEIETRRLRLRPLTPDYATALHEIYSDLEVMHYWHTPPHQSLEQTQALIASLIEGPARAWVLVPRDEETAAIGLSYFLNSSPTPGMGYILSSRHWRNGLMSEAITEIVRFGFESLRLDRIELWIHAGNVPSQRTAERNGFNRRGVFRQKFSYESVSHETLVYGLRSDEWRSEAAERHRVRPIPAYSLVPVLAVPDVRATAEFYRDQLGFNINLLFGEPPSYATVSFSEWSVAGAHIAFSGADAPAAAGGIVLYLNVGPDLDELYEMYRAAGVVVVEKPATRPWGIREFSIEDCNGYIVKFGTPA